MSVTRSGKPASRKCRFGHPHLWVARIEHDGVYDCTNCGATDDDERPADAPTPVSYGDWLAHMAGATSSPEEKVIRGLLHDVLIDTVKQAEAILDEVQGEPVAPAVGALVADLNANWLLFDSLGGHDASSGRGADQ